MTRFLTCGALAASVLGVLGAVERQQPTFRGTGEAVRVFVTVTDRDGRLVPALTRDDFEVRDEGKPQPITLFDNSPQPIRLIVMLDVSGSMEGNLPLLRAAAEQLFARLRPDDVARVGSFGREVTISPTFTRDPAALRSALPTAIAPDAPTPLWRAIDEVREGIRRGGCRAAGHPCAERREGQRADVRPGIHQPGRGDRPRARRRRDGVRHRHAQPRPPADDAGRRSGRSAGDADGGSARPRPRACRRGDRRRVRGDSLRRRSRRRLCASRRRAAQPVPHRLRSTQARRQGARHRRAGQAEGHEATRAKELRRARREEHLRQVLPTSVDRSWWRDRSLQH